MRRLLLGVAVFLVVGIILSLVFRDHQGYVLVSFNGWQIETSVLFAVAGVLLVVWLLALIWQLLVALLFAPRTWRRLRSRRRLRRARRSRQAGLLHLAEGRWATAETELEALADANEAPGLNHLFAARAAHYQGRPSERDRYLKKAAEGRSVSEVAVLMTRAELQLAADERIEASATLARLHELEPRHPWVLRLYAEHALATGDYGVLYRLLPDVRRANVLSEERLRAMSIAACRYQLDQPQDVGALTTAWRDVPRDLRHEPAMADHYARCLAALGQTDEADNVIRSILKKQYDGRLVLTFAELDSRSDKTRLATVESWIAQHGERPELMLAAGRLCAEREQYDRARRYLESEHTAELAPAELLALGRLFERIDNAERARQTYRHGLELTTRPA